MMPCIQVASLGFDCRTAFQARRHFKRERFAATVFDWQITPHAAALEYIRRDFVGMFERDDLEEIAPRQVVNRRFGTAHPHEFKHGIAADYATARSRHDALCEKARRVIHGSAPTLFVMRLKDGGSADELMRELRRSNPKLQFHVAVVDDDGIPDSHKTG